METKREKPSIFKYATKELSQDAFLCWLIQWADEKYASEDRNLHNTAVEFVKALISKQLQYEDPIKQIEVIKQWKDIDVSFTVNKEIFVIIEDKVETASHSNQLWRYKESASKWCNNKKLKLVCIYYKSGNESLFSLENVKTKGFAVFSRKLMIEILSKYQGVNCFLNDYYEHLSEIETDTNSYLSKSPKGKGWNIRAWQGFYLYLQKKTALGKWHYVNNLSKPFWGYYWDKMKCKECNIVSLRPNTYFLARN